MGRAPENLNGQRFGRLVVIGESSRKGYVMCKCDCGGTKVTTRAYLKTGNTRSCGCLRTEASVALWKKYIAHSAANLYEEMRKYGTNVAVISSNKLRKTNKSGHTGVWFNEKTGKYEAYITFRRKRKNLGVFEKISDAINAREAAEEELFAPIIAARNEEMRIATC